MRRRDLTALVTVAVLAAGTVGAPAAATTLHGSGFDPGYRDLGPISYVFNPAGFQLWFTPTDTVFPLFERGHTYHSIYKYRVASTRGWCGPTTVAASSPYDLAGTAGHTVFYKIKDVTAGQWVCGPGARRG